MLAFILYRLGWLSLVSDPFGAFLSLSLFDTVYVPVFLRTCYTQDRPVNSHSVSMQDSPAKSLSIHINSQYRTVLYIKYRCGYLQGGPAHLRKNGMYRKIIIAAPCISLVELKTT